jgi:hypothetical protein
VGVDAAGTIWVGYFDEGIFGNLGRDDPIGPPDRPLRQPRPPAVDLPAATGHEPDRRSRAMIHWAMIDNMSRRLTGGSTLSWRYDDTANTDIA